MRKLLWGCSVAGVLASAAMFSSSYYACRHPESVVGRCLTSLADASFVTQPIANVASVVAKAAGHVIGPQETASLPGSIEECVPDDPQPVAPEVIAEVDIIEMPAHDQRLDDVAPIVIPEEEPTPSGEMCEGDAPSTIDRNGMQDTQLPASVCPMVMPYCTDDEDEIAPKPSMPYADSGEKKQADGSEESENDAFRAWLKLFDGASQEEKPVGEQLAAPTEDIAEDATEEPKCQEDCHRHEHYSGCPSMTCPYTGKTYPACEPATRPGKEEASEEPMPYKHGKKHGANKEKTPHTEGVDTMEYRPSDGGLNEYGPGPM